jgi:hypothetical protein
MGWLGRRVANLQGALVVDAGQIAQVGGHGAEAAVPSGHVRVVGTVAVVWMSGRRHGCATAKAPGREPGPCCWPPRGGQTGGMLLLSPGGDNSQQFCVGAMPRAKVPRTAIEFVEPTADPTTCEATPPIGTYQVIHVPGLPAGDRSMYRAAQPE